MKYGKQMKRINPAILHCKISGGRETRDLPQVTLS